MGYASISGRARTSSKSPRAFAVCQRCGIWYNRDRLTFQNEWRGTALQNIWILVCPPCLDIPQQQKRSITLPADPVPVFYPSVENFDAAESDYRTTSGQGRVDRITGIPIPGDVLRVTQNCQNRVTEVLGAPDGLSQAAVMPWNDAIMKAFGVPLDILSVSANGTTTIQVTCSKPHNQQTNDQISVQGLSARYANGFYSVNVQTATAFTYETYQPIKQNALLTPTTRIITALVGLPRGFITIPKIKGPPVPLDTNFCYFATEDGSTFLLENGAGFISLEQCPDQTMCFLETEDGSGVFLLENGGFITLEQCGATPVCFFETEDGTGMILLENGDALTLEQCNVMAMANFELENSTGAIWLENGTDFLEQETGP